MSVDFDELSGLFNKNLNLSPEKAKVEDEPITVQKIRLKLKSTQPFSPTPKKLDITPDEPVIHVLAPQKPPIRRIIRMKKSTVVSCEATALPLSTLKDTTTNKYQDLSLLMEKVDTWFYQVRSFDIKGTPSFKDFNLWRYFAKVANIAPDLEVRQTDAQNGKGHKKKGDKVRQTKIQFEPIIPKEAWEARGEHIYIFTVNGRIVKIGCTRTSLHSRCGSYLSGHGIPEITGGKADSTNAFIYWTFVWLIAQGKKIEMWSAEIPKAIVIQTFFGIEEEIETQTCHRWERKAMIEFEKQFGKLPPLSSNYDPSE